MSHPTDTIAALATPVGTSAIAVVRASGPLCAELAAAIGGEMPPPRTMRHADYKDRTGSLLDDVLVTWFPAPNSYTGEDSLEISCHGNPLIAQKILEDLLARGCQPAEAGEFTKRAFLNGRLDLSQAEAVMDLIHARSDRALELANQQLRGALGRQVNSLITLLVSILAEVEAYVDFPEEDLPPENTTAWADRLEKLIQSTGRLLATQNYGELLREGIRTVIVGETNAGKSSLLNRLVGRDRAIVSPEPGTTRDYLEERIILGHHSLRLIDTAGLNDTSSSIERLGQLKTREQAETAGLFLWVIDSTRPTPPLPGALSARMTRANTIAVCNKIDLPPAAASPLPVAFPVVRISALHGAGLEALQAAVTKLADAFQVDLGDELVAVNARHADALRQVGDCLGEARRQLADGEPTDLLASSLRGALDALGTIAGKVDNERVLDRLFASFCIGK